MSRACLGKMIVLIYKWLKNAVSQASCRTMTRSQRCTASSRRKIQAAGPLVFKERLRSGRGWQRGATQCGNKSLSLRMSRARLGKLSCVCVLFPQEPDEKKGGGLLDVRRRVTLRIRIWSSTATTRTRSATQARASHSSKAIYTIKR